MNDKKHCRIWIEPMSREEFSGREKPLTISYSIQSAPVGRVLIASTPKGVCFLMRAAEKWEPEATLRRHFPKARFRNRVVALHKKALLLLRRRDDKVPSLCLHLYGTPFQLEVWRDLLSIPSGMVTTYRHIAERIHRPRAARPVGQAVGRILADACVSCPPAVPVANAGERITPLTGGIGLFSEAMAGGKGILPRPWLSENAFIIPPATAFTP